jgi:murein DD-endopeptidase MepM/ murein hydrolase activator NlpD
MPTLGGPSPRRPLVPIALAATAIGLLAGGVFWWVSQPPELRAAPAELVAPQLQLLPPQAPPDAGAPEEPPVQPAPVAAPTPRPPGTLRAFTVALQGPLESAIASAAGLNGPPLAQVVARTLVWWLRVPQDLARGDVLSIVYEPRAGQEPLVHAVHLWSSRLGRTFAAWRFRAEGAPFARFYQADGSELEERLVDGPLDTYEQVTSLLRDGRRHKGVDFKTPIGTAVKATFDGVVTRRNWNFRSNGNSVELAETGGQGRHALFLHLSELPRDALRPGQPVKKGEVFAHSGNTGHSFAPHLHYQLMQGEQVIDPFQSHQTMRSALPSADRPAFDAAVARLDAQLPPAPPR